MHQEMWAEFNRIMTIQRENKEAQAVVNVPKEPEYSMDDEIQEFLDTLIIEFRPKIFLEEVRRIRREEQLKLEGFKLSVVKPTFDQKPLLPVTEEFMRFTTEQ